MKLEIIEAFDRTRSFDNKAFRAGCYAPFASIYFDPLGYLKACCLNVMHPLGNISTQRLDDIWHGPAAEELRQAMLEYNFDKGCNHCKWQIEAGSADQVYVHHFERFPFAQKELTWPRMMEFALSNTCNLECIMCNGELSSRIRTRREHLPPLPKVYGDQFFEDLAKYLPHLEVASFLGGEPFLAQETLRVWDLMIEQGLQTACNVTTNGTQYNDRVERILGQLPVSLSISMDGVRRETIESIRINAQYDTLMENLRRFKDYTVQRGTSLTLTYCLMRQNWQEFGDYLLFADDWDCDVFVNVVTSPTRNSLHTLSQRELSEIVKSLDQQSEGLQSCLKRNRKVWDAELDRLRDRRDEPDKSKTRWVSLTLLDAADLETSDPKQVKSRHVEVRDYLQGWSPTETVHSVLCNSSDEIIAPESEANLFLGVDLSLVVGRPMVDLFNHLKLRFGSHVQLREVVEERSAVERRLDFVAIDGQRTEMRMVTLPRYDQAEKLVGSTTYGAIRTSPVEAEASK